MNRRVVVTGMGAVTPLGNDVKTYWNNLSAGVCGIAPITAFDASGHAAKLAAEVKIDAKEYLPVSEIRKMDRFTLLAVIAAQEVLADSGINAENSDLSRCAVLVASGIGGLATIEREHSRGLERSFDRVSPLFIPMTIANMAAGRIAINSGFRGYAMAPLTACAGGTNAIGDALRLIRHGYNDAVICGGAEGCITPLTVGGFTAMQALSTSDDPARASIPFDAERNGFIIGEGAGLLMLEELEHAKARGAKIYAEISGYGVSSDAYHITAPDPSGAGAVQAMQDALKDAGLAAADISYINAHGTSTPLNDKTETMAIKQVFGDSAHSVAVSSTKSMTGHLLGGSGGIEAVACIGAINNSVAPPTLNYRQLDPECDLDYVPNHARSMQIRHAMSNSLGFGGHNATLIFSAYE